MCKLMLGQVIKRVGLILRRRRRLTDRIAAIRQLSHARIMSRCNIISPNFQTSLQKGLPFYISVTGNTWIRCVSVQIFLYKVIHDIFFELFFEVHDIIRNVQHLCHAPCIINSRKAATAPVFLLDCLGLILPDLHGHPDDIVSCFFQEIRCHRGIYAAGHSNDYFLFSHT